MVSYSNPDFYIGPVVQYANNEFGGNCITDPSMYGETDFVHEVTQLATVTYGETTYTFDEDRQSHAIPMMREGADGTTQQYGTLVIKANGTYVLNLKDGVNAAEVSDTATYTLTDGTPGTYGTIYFQKTAPELQDNVGNMGEGYGGGSLISSFDGDTTLAGAGWNNLMTTGVANSISASFPTADNMMKPQASPYLAPYLSEEGNKYLLLTNTTDVTPALQSQIFGLADGGTAQQFLSGLGLVGSPYMAANGNMSGNFVSKALSTTGGRVVFDWSFGTSTQAVNEGDAALYVVQDADGNVVASGLLAQLGYGNFSAYGVAELDLPVSSTDPAYTLYLGTVPAWRKGTAALGQSPNTRLAVGTVVALEDYYQFSGNLLADNSPNGVSDNVDRDSEVASISYDGATYTFEDGQTSLRIHTNSDGALVVFRDGSYYSIDAAGSDGSRVAEDFSYTVQLANGKTDSAMLFIRGESYTDVGTGENETFDHSGSRTLDYIDGGAGDDTIMTGIRDNVIFGGDGNDSIIGTNADDNITGITGNDYIDGGVGNDYIDGGFGNDTLFGGGGNDTIFGGVGNDLIYGGGGDNDLTGGAGADTFAWKHTSDLLGKDSILDFNSTATEENAADKLNFNDLLDSGETLDAYINTNIKGLSLNQEEGTLSFTINDGAFSKAVEIHFNPETDSGFNDMLTEYGSAGEDTAAQQAVLMNFIINISTN
jgi:Ca2+-binding RTX toxin-like protein